MYQIHRDLNNKIAKIDQNNCFYKPIYDMKQLSYEKVIFLTFVPNRLINNCTDYQLFKQKG